MTSTARLLGVVLAGGESRRFGSPKPLATFAGEPLWRRAARVLGEVGLPTLVLANDPRIAAAVTAPVRSDLRPDRGPLAGVETGLVEARERGLGGALVLACDLVLVRSVLLADLVAAWSGEGVVAFEAPGPWGAEPLCAVWGVDLLPAVSEALDSGRGSPGALLASVPHELREVSDVDPSSTTDRTFRSVNRPADLADLVRGSADGGARSR